MPTFTKTTIQENRKIFLDSQNSSLNLSKSHLFYYLFGSRACEDVCFNVIVLNTVFNLHVSHTRVQRQLSSVCDNNKILVK